MQSSQHRWQMNTLKNKSIFRINPRRIISDVEKEIFDAWFRTWEDAAKNDLKIDMELFSDSFTRQDEIVGIYDHDAEKCIGMAFFRYINFNDPTSKKDSYFKEWPEHAQAKLIEKGKDVAVCSQFTVTADYRKTRTPFKWKDALMYSITHHFVHNTQSDVMTGAVRVNKGVNRSSYGTGAVSLVSNLENKDYNALEDLVAFYRENVSIALKNTKWLELEQLLETSQGDQNKNAA